MTSDSVISDNTSLNSDSTTTLNSDSNNSTTRLSRLDNKYNNQQYDSNSDDEKNAYTKSDYINKEQAIQDTKPSPHKKGYDYLDTETTTHSSTANDIKEDEILITISRYLQA